MFRFAWILVLLSAPAFGAPVGPMPLAVGATTPETAEGTPPRSARAIGALAQDDRGTSPVTQSVGASGWLTDTALPLAGVVALIVALAWLYRRVARFQGGLCSALGAGGRAPSGVLSVLGRYPVGGGMTLVLMQLDRRVLLVAHSQGSMMRGRPGSMSLLSEITDESDVASLLVRTQDERGESMSRRFNELLQGYGEDEPGDGPEIATVSAVDELADEPTRDLSPLRRRLERLVRHTSGERAA